jgi:hypothetical protein
MRHCIYSTVVSVSVACIAGIEPGKPSEILSGILKVPGFKIPLESIRIPARIAWSPEVRVIVKAEDSMFSMKLGFTLQAWSSSLSATVVTIINKGTNCRSVYISWHKFSRSVWLNFGDGDIAKRVAEKFDRRSPLSRYRPGLYSNSLTAVSFLF